MCARHQFDVAEYRLIIHRDHRPEFDERVSLIDTLQAESHPYLEPGSLEKLLDVIHLIPVPVRDLESLVHHESRPLFDAPREVSVHIHIRVDIIEFCASWLLYVDGLLPCPPPCFQVIACEVFRLQLQFDGHVLHSAAVRRTCQVDVSEPGVFFSFISHDLPDIIVSDSLACADGIVVILLSVRSGDGRKVKHHSGGLYGLEPFHLPAVLLLILLPAHP